MKSSLNTSDENLNVGFRLQVVKNSADAGTSSHLRFSKMVDFSLAFLSVWGFFKTAFSDVCVLLLIDLKATATLRLFCITLFDSDSICIALLLHMTLVSMLYGAFFFYS